MSTAYSTDVRSLSDEELRVLSAEIEEAYDVHDADDSSLPQDDEATDRYWAMFYEIDRRWEEANPEAAKERYEARKRLCKVALEVLSKNLSLANTVNRVFDSEFRSPKIGDTINVRRPQQFRG
jgi:hypothetical protein